MWLCVRLVFFSLGAFRFAPDGSALAGPAVSRPVGQSIGGPTWKRGRIKLFALLGSDRPAAGAFGAVGPGVCVSWADQIGGCPPVVWVVVIRDRVTHLSVRLGVSFCAVFPAIPSLQNVD